MRVAAVALCLSMASLSGGCDSGGALTGPVANPDAAQTRPGEPVTIDVLANDAGRDLTIASFQGRTSNAGTVTETAGGELSYRPGASFLGTDSFTYVAEDGEGVRSKNGTVTVVVQ